MSSSWHLNISSFLFSVCVSILSLGRLLSYYFSDSDTLGNIAYLSVLCCVTWQLFVELPPYRPQIPCSYTGSFSKVHRIQKAQYSYSQCKADLGHRSLHLSTYELVQFASFKKKQSTSYLIGLTLYEMQEEGAEFVLHIPRSQPWPSTNFFQENVPKDKAQNSDC